MDRSVIHGREYGPGERIEQVLKKSSLALATLVTSLTLGGAGYYVAEHGGSSEPQADNECFDPAGLAGELSGTGYRGQEDAEVTIELANGTRLQMPSGMKFTVLSAERTQPTLNPDGETSSFSNLEIAIENDTYHISRASVNAGWVDIEGLDSRKIDEMTLCQLENGTPPDSELVVMADSKKD